MSSSIDGSCAVQRPHLNMNRHAKLHPTYLASSSSSSGCSLGSWLVLMRSTWSSLEACRSKDSCPIYCLLNSAATSVTWSLPREASACRHGKACLVIISTVMGSTGCLRDFLSGLQVEIWSSHVSRTSSYVEVPVSIWYRLREKVFLTRCACILAIEKH